MADTQYEKMLNTPVCKLVPMLALPATISMLISSINNMVDSFYVAKLGTEFAAAVGVVYPLVTLIQAVGFTLGMGAGSLVSRLLGKKEEEEAGQTVRTAVVMAVAIGLLTAILGRIFLTQILNLLGANEETIEPAKEYAAFIVYSAPMICLSYVLSTVLRAAGKVWSSMLGLGVGGLINVILVPVFIFYFQMGIQGASVATAVSQTAGVAVLALLIKKGDIPFQIRFRADKKGDNRWLEILTNGVPSLCRQGVASISAAMLNNAAAAFSTAAMAAMSIAGKITTLTFSVMIGIAQGYQPLIGFSYGAGDRVRVRKAFFTTLLGSTILFVLMGVGLHSSAEALTNAFLKEKEASGLCVLALKLQAYALPFIPLGVLGNITFQAIGKKGRASLTSCFRQGVFYMPLILILPHFLKEAGVAAAQPLADVLTFFATIPFMVMFFRRN